MYMEVENRDFLLGNEKKKKSLFARVLHCKKGKNGSTEKRKICDQSSGILKEKESS